MKKYKIVCLTHGFAPIPGVLRRVELKTLFNLISTTLKDAEPTLKDAEPTLKDAKPTLKDAEPTLKDAEHTLEKGTLDKCLLVYDHDAPSMDAIADSFFNTIQQHVKIAKKSATAGDEYEIHFVSHSYGGLLFKHLYSKYAHQENGVTIIAGAPFS